MLNSIHWLTGGWGRVGCVFLEARPPRTLFHTSGTHNLPRHVISTSTSAIGLQAKYFLPLLPRWNISSRLLKLEKITGLLQKCPHANRLPHLQTLDTISGGHEVSKYGKGTHGEMCCLWFSRSVHCKQGGNQSLCWKCWTVLQKINRNPLVLVVVVEGAERRRRKPKSQSTGGHTSIYVCKTSVWSGTTSSLKSFSFCLLLINWW